MAKARHYASNTMPIVRSALLLALSLHAIGRPAVARNQAPKPHPQNPPTAEQQTFPPASWQPVAITDKQRQRLPKRCRVTRSKQGTLQLELKRPKGYPETVVVTPKGAMLGRSKGNTVEVGSLPIASRYVVFASQPKDQRYLRLFESFAKYPHREFPTKGWQPKAQANLTLPGVRQFAPKTMRESFEKPHRISFDTKPEQGLRLYILTKIEAGGKEQVASQAINGSLRFWPHAKRGESFRIYEVDPKDRSYRVTKPMTVARSYPLGR